MSFNPNNQKPIISNQHNFQSNYSQKTRLQLTFPENSPYTKQEFKDEADINILMSQYMATGELPNINQAAPQYLDVTGADFTESMNFIAGANTLFHELPSGVRNRFGNDTAAFLDFMSNPNNRQEMAEMGLLRPVTPEPIPYPDSGIPTALTSAPEPSTPSPSSSTPAP